MKTTYAQAVKKIGSRRPPFIACKALYFNGNWILLHFLFWLAPSWFQLVALIHLPCEASGNVAYYCAVT